MRDDLALRAGYHSPQLDVAVRLNTNEAPEPPPAAFVAALAAGLAGIEWHRYPDRRATALRNAIAAVHRTDPERVFVANGSNEVLQTLLLAYAGAGRRVVTHEPTFAMHAHIARLSGATVIEGARDDDFGLDPAEVDRTIDVDPAVTFLCSPNNPTGRVEDETLVGRLVAESPGVLCVDEAYAQFAEQSAVERLDDDRALVVTRTFSKTWSMAGARLGYLLGPPWLVAQLWEVVLPYHLDAVTQLAGRLALDFVDEMDARVARVVAERRRVSAALAELAVRTWPSSANFVLLRPHDLDGHAVWEGLVERSVLVRDCSSWPRLDGCLRVTIGTPEDNDRFLSALTEVLP